MMLLKTCDLRLFFVSMCDLQLPSHKVSQEVKKKKNETKKLCSSFVRCFFFCTVLVSSVYCLDWERD